MKIKAVKFRKNGFYTQPFAFGGEEGTEKFDKNIRYRGSLQNYLIDTGSEVTHRNADKSFANLNTYKVEQQGEKVAIIALGDFYQKGEEAAAAIEKELGFKPTLVNPRFGSGLDKDLLDDLKSRHSLVITLEDGIVDGGFGEKIASYYGPSNMKVINLGLEKKFYDRYNPQQLLESLGITAEKIIERVKSVLR